MGAFTDVRHFLVRLLLPLYLRCCVRPIFASRASVMAAARSARAPEDGWRKGEPPGWLVAASKVGGGIRTPVQGLPAGSVVTLSPLVLPSLDDGAAAGGECWVLSVREPGTAAAVAARTAAANGEAPPPPPAIIWLHGGGFFLHAADVHWEWAARLSASLGGAPVALPAYPLAPAFSSGSALRFVERVHGAVAALAAAAGAKVVLAGDSSGGGLALALAQSLSAPGAKRRRGAVPGLDALVLLSPFVDCTVPAPPRGSPAISDPMLQVEGLRAAGEMWAGAGASTEHPRCSPLLGRMAGLPPTSLWVAGRDVLSPQGLALRDALAAAEPPVRARVVFEPERYHAWQLVELAAGLPEAEASLAAVVRAIQEDCGLLPAAPAVATSADTKKDV